MRKTREFINKMQEIVENKSLELLKSGFYEIYRIFDRIQMKIKKVCFFLVFFWFFFIRKKLKKKRNKRILLKIFRILKNQRKNQINFKNLFRKTEREDIKLVNSLILLNECYFIKEYAKKFDEILRKKAVFHALKSSKKPIKTKEIVSSRLSLFISDIQKILPKNALLKEKSDFLCENPQILENSKENLESSNESSFENFNKEIRKKNLFFLLK